MMKYLPSIAILFLQIISFSLLSQSNWELSSKMLSLEVDTSLHYQFVRLQDGIGILQDDTNSLLEFDWDGRRKGMIAEFDSVIMAHIAGKAILAAGSGYYIVINSAKIVKTDETGRPVKWAMPRLKRDGKSYYYSIWGYVDNSGMFSPERNSLFLRVNPECKFSRNSEKRYKNLIEHYETPGLIAEVSTDGKLKNLFGEYDEIYREKHFLYYLEDVVFDQFKNVGLVYTLQLLDQMYIEPFDGGERIAFGERGKYMNKEFEKLPEIKDPVEGAFEKTSCILESPYNWGDYSGGRFILRIYTLGIKDTVTVSQSEADYMEKLKKGDVKGCALVPLSELRRIRLLGSKPFYIQVYDVDDNFRLIIDEPISLQNPSYLGYHDGKFYFTVGGRPPKVMAVSIVEATQPGG